MCMNANLVCLLPTCRFVELCPNIVHTTSILFKTRKAGVRALNYHLKSRHQKWLKLKQTPVHHLALPVYRHGWHHLLPGRPSAASEGQVPGLWVVNCSPQVVDLSCPSADYSTLKDFTCCGHCQVLLHSSSFVINAACCVPEDLCFIALVICHSETKFDIVENFTGVSCRFRALNLKVHTRSCVQVSTQECKLLSVLCTLWPINHVCFTVVALWLSLVSLKPTATKGCHRGAAPSIRSEHNHLLRRILNKSKYYANRDDFFHIQLGHVIRFKPAAGFQAFWGFFHQFVV